MGNGPTYEKSLLKILYWIFLNSYFSNSPRHFTRTTLLRRHRNHNNNNTIRLPVTAFRPVVTTTTTVITTTATTTTTTTATTHYQRTRTILDNVSPTRTPTVATSRFRVFLQPFCNLLLVTMAATTEDLVVVFANCYITTHRAIIFISSF